MTEKPDRAPRRRRWLRRLGGLLVFLLLFVLYAFTELSFPSSTHEWLAKRQEQLGLHEPTDEQPVFQIIGHRGSGLPNQELQSSKKQRLHPVGNTRRGIQRALEAGVDWIEIDLRATKDGVLVLFHDKSIDAKTTGSGSLAELTAAELQEISISVDPAQKVLTLAEFEEEFLPQLRERKIGLILDIKEADIADSVLSWIDPAQAELGEGKLIVFGEYRILEEYAGKGIPLGYTFSWSHPANRLRFLFRKQSIIKRLQKLDAQYLIIPVVFTTRDLIEKTDAVGIKTWTYGVDDERDWKKAISVGATGLIVDDPGRARKLRK